MAPNKAGIGGAPLTIVISCEEGAELSCGLAVQNMAAEAQLLGYEGGVHRKSKWKTSEG